MKLSDIDYNRFDAGAALRELTELTVRFQNAPDCAGQLEAYRRFMEIYKHFESCASLAYIRFTLDTQDAFYSAENDYYDEISPVVQDKYVAFAAAMLSSRFRPELEKQLSPLIFTNYEIVRKAFAPFIIEDVQEENRLTTAYKKLLSSAQIPFQGEVLNIPQLGKYRDSTDRSVRKAAYGAQGVWMKSHAAEFDGLFDRLVAVRNRMAVKMGYKNYVQLGYYRMGRNCYSPEDIAAFRSQVLADWVPFVAACKKKQAAELGVDRIMLYDDNIMLKNGNPQPAGNVLESGRKMYSELSEQTREFIDFMFGHELFDVQARKGKSGGGYCTEIPDYKMPFVFSNFNGTYDDVDTLTHEFGHALASYTAMKNIPLYELWQGGMDTCEIHSMSMEFFAWKYIGLFFGGQAEDYKKMHVANAVSFLPYGTMVDTFQQLVYEKPQMTPLERKQLWLELESKFRPYLSSEGIPYLEEGGRWQYQSHIYERPFYYIDYCLAQTVALYFLKDSLQDYSGAFSRYFSLLAKGGSQTFSNLVQEAGIPLPYAPGTLKQLAEELSKHVPYLSIRFS